MFWYIYSIWGDFDFFNHFELRSKFDFLIVLNFVQICLYNFPEHSFRGDILRISPWTFNYLTEYFIYNYIFLFETPKSRG